MLSGKPWAHNLAELTGITTFFKPADTAAIERKICSFLKEGGLSIADIDLVITGKNGDTKNDTVYHALNTGLFAGKARANYKHLCGEYPTSASFALWLAANCIKNSAIPAIALEDKQNSCLPKKILIYNHYQQIYHSLMLVTAC